MTVTVLSDPSHVSRDFGVDSIHRSQAALDQVEPPLVSVVVSTKNHATYLPPLLSAVESQTIDAPIELIVVENDSPDDTSDILVDFVNRTDVAATYVRSRSDEGPARGRNRGLAHARGEYVAFTDSDCVPAPSWLDAALARFDKPQVGVVPGATECTTDRPPFLSHFIETPRHDQAFSTSNVVYRRQALADHRFDPDCDYWEDTDLGFRVLADGWDVNFADDAIVGHQPIPQSLWQWVSWPRRYANWPAKAARYPDFRRTLFARLWVRPLHAWFDLAIVGLVLSIRHRAAAAMALPYAIDFARSRGLGGKAPLLKIGLYIARDIAALVALVAGSIRHRSVVL